MNDLHDRFRLWIAEGGRDELARDVAIHASGCASCLGAAAAVDAMSVIDLGEAPTPPTGRASTALIGSRALGPLRFGSGLAALAAIVIAAAVTFGPRSSPAPTQVGGPTASDQPDDTPAEAVLGGQLELTSKPSPSPVPTPSIAPSPSVVASDDPVETPTATSSTGAPEFIAPPISAPTPAIANPPRAPAITPSPTRTTSPTSPPPAPVRTPTPRPATPSPVPTASPTLPPTPTPTSTPTSTPEPTPTVSPSPTASCDVLDPGCEVLP